jgi:small conductance mechanosensitive channel
LEKVREIAIDAIQNSFPQDKSKEIEFHYLEFGDSSINFQMRFWVDAQAKLTMLEARSEAIIVIKKAFDAHNINIPFPIRTLDLPKSAEVALQQNQWN